MKLSGVLTTRSRQARWRRSRALSDPAATGHSQASSLGPSVSSPQRYCRDWALGPGTWPSNSVSSPHRYCRNSTRTDVRSGRSLVSSPHRYCRNETRQWLLSEGLMFQALIGTVETRDRDARPAAAFHVSSPHRYCRNSPRSRLTPPCSSVSSPHRYCRNARLAARADIAA